MSKMIDVRINGELKRLLKEVVTLEAKMSATLQRAVKAELARLSFLSEKKKGPRTLN